MKLFTSQDKARTYCAKQGNKRWLRTQGWYWKTWLSNWFRQFRFECLGGAEEREAEVKRYAMQNPGGVFHAGGQRPVEVSSGGSNPQFKDWWIQNRQKMNEQSIRSRVVELRSLIPNRKKRK